MIRLLALALALTVSASVSAQSADTASVLKPNPVSMVITVVPWLLKDNEPYYFVTVKGYGRTTEEAKTQALRAGVDQAVGSVINSEREVNNQRLQRSEVVQYAAGFVDKYEVKQIENENGFVAMTLDVWVKRSRLTDRLLGDHRTPGQIDGDRLQTQAETLTHSRQQGDRLLQAVLADFPRRAFDIEQGHSRVYYNDQRQQQLELSFRLKWRRAYLENLREALAAVSQNANAGDCVGAHARSCQYQGYVTIKARPGVHGWSRTAAFDDSITLDIVRQNLIDSRPAVLITLEDRQGRRVYHGCQRWGELDNVISGYVSNERLLQPTHNGLQINGHLILDARVPFNLTASTPTLDQVKMEVVRNNQCPNI
jgi:hypothetical protein